MGSITPSSRLLRARHLKAKTYRLALTYRALLIMNTKGFQNLGKAQNKLFPIMYTRTHTWMRTS